MALADMPRPSEPCTAHVQHFHDGSRRVVYCTAREEPFPEGRLIVSHVDLAGRITHANDAFVQMSGYAREELIGAPHHILRHPDMPRSAYAEMWRAIEDGRKWQGWVKNLRKDGAYYWVSATVVPNIRQGIVTGYTSVRRKPSRSKVAEMEALYARMVAAEKLAA